MLVNINNISIREISKSISEKMIIKNHYTHKWTQCKFALGIFLKNEMEHDFFSDSEKLIGCIVYGNPVGRCASKSISPHINDDNIIELTRLWIDDCSGKNTESYVISQSFNWIRKYYPNIKCVLSYADDEHHTGKIYQATNFIFMGRTGDMNKMPNFSVSLTKDPYNWIHSRTVTEKFGSQNVQHLKKVIGKTFYRKKEASKFKYVYFLGNKKENRLFLKTLKQCPKEYPKNSLFKEEIEIHEVDDSFSKNDIFV